MTSDKTLSPTEWFDQFSLWYVEQPDDQWAGRQFCPRHWAPCPLLYANGIMASTLLIQIFVDELAEPNSTPDQLNQKMLELSPICCQLGDERMYKLWGKCPPAGRA